MMLTDHQVNCALRDMEEDEHAELSWYLTLALMEESYEEANAYRSRLQKCKTLGQLRAMVEAKVDQHFPAPDQSSPRAQDFVADW